MVGFLIALIATIVLGTGGRDQVLLAGLAAKLGKRVSLLAAGLFASALTVLAAAWLAALITAQLKAEDTAPLAALALGLAGLEMAMIRLRRIPTEPTRSLGAITLVLLAFQASDAVRLASFALLLTSSSTVPTAAGAAFGSMAALTMGWALGERHPTLRLAGIRRWLGIVMVALAGTFLLLLR